MDNEYKLKLNVRIAMLYLEDDDSVNAEMFIKKASSLVSSVKVHA
jgi:COP9 signalosome complex subunit 4